HVRQEARRRNSPVWPARFPAHVAALARASAGSASRGFLAKESSDRGHLGLTSYPNLHQVWVRCQPKTQRRWRETSVAIFKNRNAPFTPRRYYPAMGIRPGLFSNPIVEDFECGVRGIVFHLLQQRYLSLSER